MKEQQKGLPDQSSSKKRSGQFNSEGSPKRVALGEITNSLNIQSTPNSDFPIVQKSEGSLKRSCDEDRAIFPSKESYKGSEFRGYEGELQHDKKENEEPSEEKNDESPLQKCSYSSSIYNHLRSVESEDHRRPLPNYLQLIQNDIKADMRELLIDWLIEVAEDYKLFSDTLFLAVSHLDRFLSSRALSKKNLQLLGVCCLLIASKYEEINPPNIQDFCYLTDNTYTENEVLEMENEVQQFLNYDVGTPTIKNFLRLFMAAAQEKYKSPDMQFEFLCCYLAELSLLNYGCVQYLPSVVAASAIFLSRFIMQPEVHPWTMALQMFSGYKPSDLRECILAIHDLLLNIRGSPLDAITDKYMQPKFKKVAALSSPPKVPACYFEAENK